MALTRGVLLDTHTLIWLQFARLTGRPETMDRIRDAAASENWFVSAFSLFEIAHAISRKRLKLDIPLARWFDEALRYPGPQVIYITPEVAAATLDLPSTFHGDPGDRIVAATAILHNLTLCTHDDVLLRFSKQGLFPSLKVKEMKE